MTRGRLPQKGLDIAIPVARDRGLMMEFRQTAENLCEFVIVGNNCIAFVRVRKARRLHGPVPEVEHEFSAAIVPARTIPASGPVSRELWIYSRHGILRFFRITDAGIIEIDRSGQPLVTDECGPVESAMAGGPGTLLGAGAAAEGPALALPAEVPVMVAPADSLVPGPAENFVPAPQADVVAKTMWADLSGPEESRAPADLPEPAGAPTIAEAPVPEKFPLVEESGGPEESRTPANLSEPTGTPVIAEAPAPEKFPCVEELSAPAEPAGRASLPGATPVEESDLPSVPGSEGGSL